MRRYRLLRLPLLQTRILKALSLLPQRTWQLWTTSCNPLAPGMAWDALRQVERYDVIHAMAFPYAWPLACARLLARRLSVPLVLTPFLHLGDPDDSLDRTRRAYTHPALLSLARDAAAIFVQTDLERQALLERGFASERVFLQGMGLDVPSCTGGDRIRVRRAWGVATDEVVVGHLANQSREKGSVDLLRAAELAWRRGGRFRIVLAGPEMPNFVNFWSHYRLKERVVRLGVLDAGQKRDFFAGLDVFALPSRSDSFGIVLLEAWANGVPNVGYRAGGVAGVIRDESDGLLVRCGDVAGLAAALLRLAGDGDLRQRLGQNGRERTRNEFDWDEKCALVRRVYEQVCTASRFRLGIGRGINFPFSGRNSAISQGLTAAHSSAARDAAAERGGSSPGTLGTRRAEPRKHGTQLTRHRVAGPKTGTYFLINSSPSGTDYGFGAACFFREKW